MFYKIQVPCFTKIQVPGLHRIQQVLANILAMEHNMPTIHQKTIQKLATFFSPWRSIWPQIQHLLLTLDRISGPDISKILPGARWATRRPQIQKMSEDLGVRTQTRDVLV